MNRMTSDQDSRNLSTVAYLLPIGFIVAYLVIRFFNYKNDFTTFHLRQSFGVNMLFVVLGLLFKTLDIWVLIQIGAVIYVLTLIYAIIGVREGKRLYVPMLGKIFDGMFTFI
ncbi:MAG: hypothetical protein MJZ15_06140 [Bacteroidales bacterium]|nr:hypothetical protein [Bacteroidales bacterium]